MKILCHSKSSVVLLPESKIWMLFITAMIPDLISVSKWKLISVWLIFFNSIILRSSKYWFNNYDILLHKMQNEMWNK